MPYKPVGSFYKSVDTVDSKILEKEKKFSDLISKTFKEMIAEREKTFHIVI